MRCRARRDQEVALQLIDKDDDRGNDQRRRGVVAHERDECRHRASDGRADDGDEPTEEEEQRKRRASGTWRIHTASPMSTASTVATMRCR